MNAGVKLGAYGLLLVAVLGAGSVVGATIGPNEPDDEPEAGHLEHGDESDDAHGDSAAGRAASELPGGVVATLNGLTLAPDQTVLSGSPGETFSFQVVADDGTVVHDFEVRHERELHLVVVSSDLATFHHLHPERDADGTWSTRLPRLVPGTYRAYADFAPAGGDDVTLGVLLSVPGEAEPTPPAAGDTASVDVDGYHVTLDGELEPGATSDVSLTIERDGEPVDDLEPYLGADGHLVAVRDGDLAYLHVHPLDDSADGDTVEFAVEIPSPGRYRLFFEFAHDGSVHAADFTVDVGVGSADHDDDAHQDDE